MWFCISHFRTRGYPNPPRTSVPVFRPSGSDNLFWLTSEHFHFVSDLRPIGNRRGEGLDIPWWLRRDKKTLGTVTSLLESRYLIWDRHSEVPPNNSFCYWDVPIHGGGLYRDYHPARGRIIIPKHGIIVEGGRIHCVDILWSMFEAIDLRTRPVQSRIQRCDVFHAHGFEKMHILQKFGK